MNNLGFHGCGDGEILPAKPIDLAELGITGDGWQETRSRLGREGRLRGNRSRHCGIGEWPESAHPPHSRSFRRRSTNTAVGEELTPTRVLGGGLILAGILLIRQWTFGP